ncbi:TadE/TadG family type IV pilus assembly protein [Salinarimonas ramus]|uniref:Pilus assembly protein FlpL n=1 Tax=Salinarimonas ramus TaxID=690164 RepID=A0A917Q6I3_9HYPH|nr:pilus assembly protein TadG-related protein [Salinarimonas ramus]GGK22917.1 pilus assembly protein FlpL [Salinarimonas ramus]
MTSRLRRFTEDRSGAVAIALGLVLVPVIGVAGAAVDYTRLSADRAELQRAADAAAIATARAAASPGADLETLADDIVAANVIADPSLRIDDVAHREENGLHIVEIEATRANVLSKVMGFGDQALGVHAAATMGGAGGPTEVSIVFDVTRSMTYDNNYVTAMLTLGNTLERMRGDGESDSLRVSLVPASDRVNLRGVVSLRGGEHAWLAGRVPNGRWNGCVEPRPVEIEGRDLAGVERTFPEALDDAPPTGDGRFLPSIEANLSSPNVGERYRNDLPACSRHRLVGPTESIDTIRAEIEDYGYFGTGRIDIGLAWAWRLLSPRWQGHWGVASYPAAYGASSKVAIVVTDGHTVAYDYEVLPESGKAETDYGNNNGTPNGFSHLADLCGRMKATGIRIVMVQLEGNENFNKYARACASGPEDYFLISETTSLSTAFADIEAGEGPVRLVR